MPEIKNRYSDNIIRPLKSENQRIIICALMIIVCGLIRPYTNGDKVAAGQNAVSTLVYIGVLSQWLVSIRRRFIQKEMKRYLAFAAFLMIFFLAVRFVKYEYCDEGSAFFRHLLPLL